MDSTWLFGGAIVAAVASAWSYIKGLWSYLASFVVVTHSIDSDLGYAVCEYANRHWKRSPYGPQDYGADEFPLRATRQYALMAFQNLSVSSLFWVGWKPVWIATTKGDMHNGRQTSVTFIRGMLKFEQLCIDAAKHMTRLKQGMEERRRFKVQTLGGKWSLYSAAKETIRRQSRPSSEDFGDGNNNSWDFYGRRLIGYRVDEVGIDGERTCALDDLSLSPEAWELVESVRRWHEHRAWYDEHRVPWKIGARLVGMPGNGKSALTRAIAYDLDLPVFMFDLATMDNDDLRDAWKQAMAQTPCLVLFEDIDSVFDGRTPVNERSPLTFDTLLQCLDGIEQYSGVLCIVTTNYRDKLDPALTREGRTDFEVEMLPPDDDGLRKIARRILGDDDELIERMVSEASGMSGAAAQQKFTQAALKMFWGKESYAEEAAHP